MGEEDPLHFWVLDMVAALVFDHLFCCGVDKSDEDILFLSDSVGIQKLKFIFDSIVGLCSFCALSFITKVDETSPLHFNLIATSVEKLDHEMEKV